ncbi:SDR family oxidoreductase [Egicoccus halophilus]|uniref:NAD-dependent dehydratase n=1 Tax=Egicoccus halophilus TaxID=1670830 RepID=A0A8J3AAN5_9ACTN|nr:SDR family oxidoreductase [Egicoccus halophilus]GGI06769.1 NAD-dependent dehydratase [Egicoccus halophilus]
MRVAIAGGNGTIARHLARILTQNGDEVRSIVRRTEQFEQIREHGAEPVLCDLEEADAEALAEAVGQVDAVVFAAGAGPGSGPERKETVDHGGAVKLIEAARLAGVSRYVIVSSIGADADHQGEEVFDVYLRAKGRADEALAASGLDHTIVRPVGLTDEPGTGRVTLEASPGAEIPREDVAATIAVCLAEPATIGQRFDLAGGDTPISEALAG